MTKPHVLLLHCHDLGRFLGCYGVGTVRTPNLDALAADGVRFERAFCTAPQCSPSRASLFTGRYPHSAGVNGLTHAQFAWDLYPEERHLAQELKDAGYTTSLLGVQHESRTERSTEEMEARLGFDRAVPAVEKARLPNRGRAVAEAACAELDRLARGEQPFYLQVGFVEPHRLPGLSREEPGYMGFISDYMEPDDELGVTIPPYLADEGESTRAELAELQGAIRYMDRAVGQVLTRLDELGLTENTLVIFTTDHGVALPRAKCALYDPGLEIALMMRCPTLGWTGGQVRSEMVSGVDLFPTVLDAVGLQAGARIHGRSLRLLLDGVNGGHDARRDAVYGEMTYHTYYDPRRCVRTETHKLIVNFTAAPGFMDPSQSWRPRTTPRTVRSHHRAVELYDLVADPNEAHDVADEPGYADVRSELLRDLYGWMRDTGDPLLGGAVTSPLHEFSMSLLERAAVPGTVDG